MGGLRGSEKLPYKIEWIIIPPVIAATIYVWERVLKPFLEKDAVTPEEIEKLKELINTARENGAKEIQFKVEAKKAVGLQKKLHNKIDILLGAEKDGKIDVTIKFNKGLKV